MKKLEYKINIEAPKEVVYEKMLGRATYKQWTSLFNPTSDFEGGWNKGDKIRFIGISEEGKKEGMLAQIAENIPNEYVSIRHYGLVDGNSEITEGPAVEAWAPSFENYTFLEDQGITTVVVEVDTNEEYFEYFNEAWPKALNKLKEISEQ
ncbi:SRPBCC family protein [Sphingobacterium arenae]|uniref:SRPBCC domain-containing protein n=1 Tax=Sphingobacterium arenae TaxID=1280598 RepID=A0ABR7Y3D5_9SPHI|nr:SRPBCC domain-containing protein [Sphingobacterium arenae]MBD1425789.1 SRPBCC domain-containing protein [Sphingobacterium arenae]